MRPYLFVTGTVFALIVVAHVARAVAEGMTPMHDPWWDALTLLAAGLSIWAFRLALKQPKTSR